MSILQPNMMQTESRMSRISDKDLANIIQSLTAQGQAGTPEYIIAAGEIQARKSLRQATDAQTPQRPPVLAELLSGVTVQPQADEMPVEMMQLPENQGIGALPAPNMEKMDEYAGGGIVAFDDGGEVQRFQGQGPSLVSASSQPIGFSTALSGGMGADPNVLRAFFISQNMPIPYELMTDEERARIDRRPPELGTRTPRAAAAAAPGATPTPVPVPAPAAPGAPPAPPAAPAGIQLGSPMTFPQAIELAKPNVLGLMGQRPNVPEIGTRVQERVEAMRGAGYDPELFKKQREEIEKEREAAKGDKREAVNLRLIEAGLGIMGGESPYAFVNIGKGASPALKGLQEDIKDLKKVDRERNKAIRDINVAQNQVAAGIGGAALDDVRDAQNRLERFDQMDASIRASMAGTIYKAENDKYLKQLEIKGTETYRDVTLQQQRINNAQEVAKDIMARSPLIPGTPEYAAQFKELTRMLLQSYSTSSQAGAAPQPTIAARYDSKGNRIQ